MKAENQAALPVKKSKSANMWTGSGKSCPNVPEFAGSNQKWPQLAYI